MDLTKGVVSYPVIEHFNMAWISIIVTIIMNAPKQVKITSNHHWVLCRRNSVMELLQKILGKRVVGRAVPCNDLPLELLHR